MNNSEYVYRIDNLRVVDGDTVDCDIDLGFDVWLRSQRIRLSGVDAPETRTRDLNEKAAFLTTPIINEIRGKLDKASFAYSFGMDRSAFAALTENMQMQNALWAEAMTQYAKAQLYAQMAKTALLKARASTP